MKVLPSGHLVVGLSPCPKCAGCLLSAGCLVNTKCLQATGGPAPAFDHHPMTFLGFWLCFQSSQRGVPWEELSSCGQQQAGCAPSPELLSPWEWVSPLTGQGRSLPLAITLNQRNAWCWTGGEGWTGGCQCTEEQIQISSMPPLPGPYMYHPSMYLMVWKRSPTATL